MRATPTAPLFMTCVSTVATKPMNSANTTGELPPKIGSTIIMRKFVIPLSCAAMAPESGCTTASRRMMPHATPESIMALNFSKGLPSTLRKHITVTRNTQIPVLPMDFRNLEMNRSAGRKFGSSSRATSAKRKQRMSFCTLLSLSAPSVSSLLASSFLSFSMSGLNTYLPSAMNRSEHSTQEQAAMSMYLA